MRRLALAVVILLVVLRPSAGHAQTFDPKARRTYLEQALIAAFAQKDALHVPTAKQVDAPATTAASPGIVNLADASSLLSAAVNRVLAGEDAEALTISLDMYAFKASPAVEYDQREYMKYSALRRLSGSITLGGAGDSAAIDTAQVQRLKSITDVWSINGRWRFFGSRDRREHWKQYLRRAPGLNLVEMAREIGAPLNKATNDEERFQVCLDYFQSHPEVTNQLATSLEEANDFISAVNDSVDKNLLLTLSVVGDFMKEELGRDKLTIELIAQGGNFVDITGNLAYHYNELENAREDQEVTLALAFATKIFRGTPTLPDGADLTFAVSGDMRNNHRKSVWKLNAKLDLPVQGKLKFTSSVTWANRQDLIDEKIVRGNWGLSYDLSGSHATP